MIYPRLRLAKNLMSEDGVILISIDDSEVENLCKVSNEVFGEINYLCHFIWKSRQNKDNRNLNGISIDHEYIVAYCKTPGLRLFKGEERTGAGYSNPDNDPRGPWTSANMAGIATESQRPNLHYDLINPETGINYGRPKMGWRYDKKTMAKLIREGRILWPDNMDGRPRKKSYLYELQGNNPGFTSLVGDGIFTRNGTVEIDSLFDERYFAFPKPTKLIKDFITQICNNESLILDFFSGSATTAHAVMQLNAEDGGHRKFIMVQLPEKTDESSEAYKAGYPNICEIGKERIRRAGRKIREEAGLTAGDLDIGFRVLRLDSSNMQDVYYNPAAMTQDLLSATIDNIKPDRTPEDLLFQVMLDLGVELSSPISETTIDGKTVFDVANGFLLACFDSGVTTETVTAIAKRKPYYAVFRDSSLADDSTATNFDQIFETYSHNTVRKVI